MLPETETIQTLTRISTDEGPEGYYLGGRGHGDQDGLLADQRAVLEGRIKALVLGLSTLGLSSLWMAVFADVGVAVLAILNAMRALRLTADNKGCVYQQYAKKPERLDEPEHIGFA